MRIINLSPEMFNSHDDMRRFFHEELLTKTPPGKFRVTQRKIAQDGLKSGEQLIFTCWNRVVFTARTESGLLPNDDEGRVKYPSYFVLDLKSLCEADEAIDDINQQYKGLSGDSKSFTSSGWPHLTDSVHTEDLWARLRRLRAEEAAESESNNGDGYTPQEGDLRPLAERQIRIRRGQQQFRDELRRRYLNRCLVTGCEVLAVLEAAHIKPHRGKNDDHPENGFLLRADIHTLFDLDLLGIEPDQLRVELHPNVIKEYGYLIGKTLGCVETTWPSRDALQQRYKKFCEGLPPMD